MFLIGCLSLVGVIPFVGFFSKEGILGLAFSRPGNLGLTVWSIGLATALITGFYTGRMWWMSFAGKPSPQRPVEHPHEAPSVMLIPVAILAVLATVGGLIQTRALGFGPSLVSDYLDRILGGQNWEETSFAVYIGLVTMLVAGLLFVAARSVRPWSARFPWAQRILERKYYFDEIYNAVFVRTLDRAADIGFRDVETPIIDGSLVGAGTRTTWAASYASLLQTGYFRNYALVFVAGAVIVAVLLLARFAT
jgi:NADH-quinone oxidoreductase subunit L